jgi:hypothetical protein
MLQVYVLNVLSAFSYYVASVFILMSHMFHTYVASLLSGCCICFAMAFHVFSGVFVSVSDAYFKCFICLQTYIANVYVDVLKVDRVLHMLQWRRWQPGSGLS